MNIKPVRHAAGTTTARPATTTTTTTTTTRTPTTSVMTPQYWRKDQQMRENLLKVWRYWKKKERPLYRERSNYKWRRSVVGAGCVGWFWEPLPQFFHTIRSIQMWEPSITDLLILYSPKFLNPPTPKKSICPLDPHHGDAFTGLTNMYVSPILHLLALRKMDRLFKITVFAEACCEPSGQPANGSRHSAGKQEEGPATSSFQ